MAAIAATLSRVGDWHVFTWSDVTEADTFVAANIGNGLGRALTVQVGGTLGGATVVMQGSNDNSTFVALKDVEDAAISHTAAGGSEMRYAWPYMRPSASGGSSQAVDVTLAVMLDAR